MKYIWIYCNILSNTQVCFALKPLTHSLTSGCITLPAVQEDSDEDSDCEYDHDDGGNGACGGGGGDGGHAMVVVVVVVM